MKNPSLDAVANRLGKLAACLLLGVAVLPQSARSAPTYSAAALANNPAAFWQLNETGDPSSGALSAVDSSPNVRNGTYGTTSQNGYNSILSPQPPTYQGFSAGQGALQTAASDVNSVVTLPALNLSSTVVDTTIAMWIYPNSQPPQDGGLLFDRSGSTSTAGFGFQSQNSSTGLTALGYNWNDANATWSWNSGLYPPVGAWSYVALVVQTNKATVYLYYIDPNTQQPVLASAVNTTTHSPVTWSGAGPRWLGGDQNNANRTFPGIISGAAVYNAALSSDQILGMFAAGLGLNGFAPSITGHPQPRIVLAGSPVQMRVTAGGTSPLAYQWQLNGTNVNLLPDSANFVGANSNVLTILSAAASDVGGYQVVVTNVYGTATSSNAVLSLQAPSLVGQWLTNGTLSDVSGYTPAGTHNGTVVGGGNYVFTNDVPNGKAGQSLLLFGGDTGIQIDNSSTVDANPTNTFDLRINNAMTVSCWAKGWPGIWNPFVSKYGENGLGWQLRQYGFNGISPCWTIRGTGQADDMAATSINLSTDTNSWHLYVGTYDAATRVRNLYVDGVLAVSQTNNGIYAMSPTTHLVIGAREDTSHAFGTTYFTGQIYDVRVYNYALDAATVLNVYGVVAPSIAAQPQSIKLFAGQQAKFTVTASGTPPLSYQWQLNGTNVNLLPDSANFVGVNSNVLTILNVSSNDVGAYKVIITSTLGYGTVTSSNATLSLLQPMMIGRWFNGAASLADVSGYQPAGTHDGYAVGAANYVFTNDVPAGMTGQSIWFPGTDSGIAIANTSTADGTYTNTFDRSEFSVSFWAKDRGAGGAPWLAWVAKDGYNNNGEYNGIGWSVGTEAWNQFLYFDMEGIDNGGITYTLGDGLWGNGILQCSPQNLPGENTQWHHYAVTYSAVTGIRRTYFDGTLVAQQNGCAQYAYATDKHLTIACQEQTVNGMTGFHRGFMYDVRMFNYAMTSNQVLALIPDPVVNVQPPATLTAYVGGSTKIAATVRALTAPVTNRWQLNGVNLNDGAYGGAIISGANSSTLTLSYVTTNLQGVYRLVVSDPAGMTVSSNTTLTVLSATAPPAGNLVGAWITGAANLADNSGHTPAGTHDGYGVSGAGVPSSNFAFTNDVPSGKTGQSLTLRGNTVIAITNSSTLDAGYVNTFDDTINNAMTVSFWAKGLPGGWNPWVSKYGEGSQGWQLRIGNPDATPCWTVRDGGAGSYVLGNGPSWAMNGDLDDMHSPNTVDTGWHHYAGTYDAATGIRNLYVDGVLKAQESGNVLYGLSTSSHVAIGGRDSATGNSFGSYFTGNFYGVRIYNTALTESQVNSFITLPPVFVGPPVLNGNKLVLTWAGGGTLLQATNITGPWVSSGATSPYTNDISASPQMFFKLQ